MEPGARPEVRESFDPIFFEALFKAEDQHFWFLARNRIIAAIIRQLLPSLPPGYRVLEVGCGTGNVLRLLERECAAGSVTGMDLFSEGLRFARQRCSCPLIMGDISSPPFREPFHFIGVFDVLEHLDGDEQALTHLNRMLAPGGVLLITVPAHPHLWSYFDVASCHRRRYAEVELTEKLSRAGFKISYVTQFMSALFPLAWVKRRLFASARPLDAIPTDQDRELAVRELSVVPILNWLMLQLISLERFWLKPPRRLRLGTSLLAIVRKPTCGT